LDDDGFREKIMLFQRRILVAWVVSMACCLQLGAMLVNGGQPAVEPKSKAAMMMAYPPPEEHAERMKPFYSSLGGSMPPKERDLNLRRVVERVPVDYARDHFADLQKNAEEMGRRIDEVRALDEHSTFAFIRKAREERDTDILCVCLLSRRLGSVEIAAAEALASLADPKSMRCLSLAFSQVPGSHAYKGGLKVKLLNQKLRIAIAKAIGATSGMDVVGFDGSDEATRALRKQCEAWLNDHPEDEAKP